MSESPNSSEVEKIEIMSLEESLIRDICKICLWILVFPIMLVLHYARGGDVRFVKAEFLKKYPEKQIRSILRVRNTNPRVKSFEVKTVEGYESFEMCYNKSDHVVSWTKQ